MQIVFIKKICPITFGLPTRMTQQGFERSCWEKQQNVVRTSKGPKFGRKTNPVCAICKGVKPAELEIVVLEEEGMALVTKPDDCPLCSSEGQTVELDPPAAPEVRQALEAAPWLETDEKNGQACAGSHCSGGFGAWLRGEQSDAVGCEGRETSAQRFAALQEILGVAGHKDAVAMLAAVAVLTQEFDRLRKRCAELVKSLAAREKELAQERSLHEQAPSAVSSADCSAVFASPS
jgi:hypothetical protein